MGGAANAAAGAGGATLASLANWLALAGHGWPLLLVATILIEAGCGLLILIGWRAREAALLLFLFLIPVTLIFHGFWSIEDLTARAQEQRAFMKNLAIMGGVLMIAGLGAGPLSLQSAKPGSR